MALAAGTEWEVRTTGNDANGGGFNPTNGSMSTNLAATVGTTTAPVVTSASYNFVAGDVGAFLFIQSGTNWKPGWYPIVSVASNAATLNATAGAWIDYTTLAPGTTNGCASTGSPTSGVWTVDYSQQDSPRYSFTDMVIDGTTNTKFTSVANPVGVNFVANIVNITSGTGFTVQRSEVVSVTGTTATCDKSLGTLSSTGGTGKLGGGLLTLATSMTCVALNTASNTVFGIVHVKSGTYTITSSIAVTPGSARLEVWGYGSLHRDLGTKPLITTATNSIDLLQVTSSFMTGFINLSMSNTAATRAIGIAAVGGAYPSIKVQHCIMDGFTYHIKGDNSGNTAASGVIVDSEFKNSTVNGCWFWWDVYCSGCYFHGNTGVNLKKTSSQNHNLTVLKSIFSGGVSAIVGVTGIEYLTFLGNTIYNTSSDGISIVLYSWLILENNIIYNCGGYGINAATGGNVTLTMSNRNNAFGNNTSGNRESSVPVGFNEIPLSAGPFNNAGTGDFSLNNVIGGGASLRRAGFPSVFQGGTSTSYLDLGPVQTSGSPGSGGGTCTFIG